MAITREKKEELSKKLEGVFADARSVVFVNFHKLSVAETTKLRNTLRSQGVGYLVAKKSLTRRALGTIKVEGEVPAFDGELAIAYGADALAPAREVYAFQKDHQDTVAIVGGIFEGKFANKEEMTNIATIPPLKVLQGMFVNLINSPIQGLVVGLNQIAEKKG